MNDLLQAFTALTGLSLICEFTWSPQINFPSKSNIQDNNFADSLPTTYVAS